MLKIAMMTAAFLMTAATAQAASLAGVPMSEHHFKVMGGDKASCATCHGVNLPTSRPDGKACVSCHGTMDKIPTKPNKFDKFPHASAHYGDTLECTACHAEHKPSKAVCNDCHNVQWTNFK